MTPKKFLLKTIRETGKVVLRGYRGTQSVRYKDKLGYSPVTKTDLAADLFFHRAVRRFFPNDGYLSEELAPQASFRGRYTWIVDPIDGTRNFVSRVPFFAVSAARINPRGEIEIGALYDPLHDELFFAERGKGATLNGKRLSHHGRRMEHVLRYGGWSEENDGALIKRIRRQLPKEEKLKVYRFGSAALALCYLAAGRLDLVGMFGGFSLWDVAGALIVLQEAGIRVVKFNGKPYTLQSQELVAAPPKLLRLFCASK